MCDTTLVLVYITYLLYITTIYNRSRIYYINNLPKFLALSLASY